MNSTLLAMLAGDADSKLVKVLSQRTSMESFTTFATTVVPMLGFDLSTEEGRREAVKVFKEIYKSI